MKFEYKLSLFLFVIMSLFSGHIFIKPAVSIYMALVFNLNKKVFIYTNSVPYKTVNGNMISTDY